jgi:hypothetical protein
MNAMRAAVYARFSSENQREQSIEAQVRVCRASTVAIESWASTGAAARLEAFDAHDAVVARDAFDVVTGRKAPEVPPPCSRWRSVQRKIAYVEFSGPRTGEFPRGRRRA